MIWEDTKLRVGNYLKDARIAYDDDRVYLKFGYNKQLLAEVKCLEGARWHKPEKMWSAKMTDHTEFQLQYLRGGNPYRRYDVEVETFPLPQVLKDVRPYLHQLEMYNFMLTRRRAVLAAQQGTGKTLVMILVMAYLDQELGPQRWLYVGPKSAMTSVKLEWWKWGYNRLPEFCTYASLKKKAEGWTGRAPYGLIGDECSRLKNPNTQRTEAFQYIADNVRYEYSEGVVLLASGTPSPKAPTDWFSICRVACPGFLKEPNLFKMRDTLALTTEQENQITGGRYKSVVRWRDTDTYCNKCGKEQSDHDLMIDGHAYDPGPNEVSRLYKRMEGLVMVVLREDCLDLPDRVFKRIICPPTDSLMRAAKMLVKTQTSVAVGLGLVRELSDGFQYAEEKTDRTEKCDLCKGKGRYEILEYIGPEDEIHDPVDSPDLFEYNESDCPTCNGAGKVPVYERVTKEFKSPKEEALADILADLEENRIIIYASFQGSIDKVTKLVLEKGWDFIQWDGRKVKSNVADSAESALQLFQSDDERNIAFIANPASASTGLTLTKASTMVYYSNSFNLEDRLQSLDRNYRLGQTKNCTVIDLICLPTDEMVLENLEKKKGLQDITLGKIENAFEQAQDSYAWSNNETA